MKALITLLALIVVLGVAFVLYRSPPAGPEMTEAERAQIEAEVTEAAAGLLESFRTLDAEAVAEWFHPTETSWASNGTIYDRAGLIEFLGSFLEPIESFDGAWVETTVKVLNPKAAMFQGRYQGTDHFKDGRILHWPGNANYTMLMERTPEGWKATIGNWSSGAGQEVETP
jgi:hypothetical protein